MPLSKIDLLKNIFKLSLFGLYWLIKLYSFQAYNSISYVYSMCTHHLKSNPPLPYIWSPLTFNTPTPFPLVTTILLSVSMTFCLIIFLFICCFQCYIPHEWNHDSWLFLWLISFCIVFSRFIHVTSNGSISSFHMAE